MVINTKEKPTKTNKSKDMESNMAKINIGASGPIINETTLVTLKHQVKCMLGNGEIINIMERVFLSVEKQINFIKDTFLMDKEMVLGYGKILKGKCMLDSGKIIRNKEKDTITIQ